jgi:hypothetical protein
VHANKSEPLIIGTDPETGRQLTLWDKRGGRVISTDGKAALWDELTERVAARSDAVLLRASPDGQARRTLVADPGTAAIVSGLLSVATAIEDTAERMAEDLDTVAAMLDDRITSVEGAMDAVAAALLPAPGPVYRNPVHEIYVRLRYRWRAWRGTAPIPWVALDCVGMCGKPAHDCGGCCCAGGCRCPHRCRCAEALWAGRSRSR